MLIDSFEYSCEVTCFHVKLCVMSFMLRLLYKKICLINSKILAKLTKKFLIKSMNIIIFFLGKKKEIIFCN